MRIFESLRFIISENVLLQQLKDKYVGEGKPVSNSYFALIENVCQHKFYLIQWLTKKVGTGIIKSEDIYKFEEYFETFEKNKNKFELKDINQYKTSEDVSEFIRTCIRVKEEKVKFDEIPQSENYLSSSEIEKLEKGGSKFLGMFENYQVFQIIKPTEENWKVYRDLLGRCKGREKGAKIHICTISNYDYFKRYLEDPKGSNYFVLYDLNDDKSPYQLHLESGQFMDKNDDGEIKINKFKFYEWLAEKTTNYKPEKINKILKYTGKEIPVKNKGWVDEKGKQGTWHEYWSGGSLRARRTYKDNFIDGTYTEYEKGKVSAKWEYKDGERNGKYISYDDEGNINEKGEYREDMKVGEWFFYYEDKSFKVVDYNQQPVTTTFYDKNNNKEKEVSKLSSGEYITKFHSNGQPSAEGLRKRRGRSGLWKFYNPNGKLFAKGKYAHGNKSGVWEFYVKERVKVRGKIKVMDFVYKIKSPEYVEKYTSDEKLVKKWSYWDDKVDKIKDKLFYSDKLY